MSIRVLHRWWMVCIVGFCCSSAWAAEPQRKVKIENFDLNLVEASVRFTPDGTKVMAHELEEVHFWNAASGEKEALKWPTLNSWSTSSEVLFSRDGKTLYLQGYKRVEGYDVASGKRLGILEIESPPLGSNPIVDKKWTLFESVVTDSENRPVIAGIHNSTVRVWDFPGGKTRELPEHPASLNQVRISPDGKSVVATYYDSKHPPGYRLSDVISGKVIYDGPLPAYCSKTLAFSPDGKILAWKAQTGFKPDHFIRLAEANSGKIRADLRGHAGSLSVAVYSPDGKYIATASFDKTARVWDAATGRSLAVIKLEGIVWAVDFSPDGKRLVIGADDRQIQIWDLNLAK